MIGCCCEDCTIGQDLFEGNLDNWTTTGTVAIDDPNNRLEMTGASSAYFDFVPASGDDWVGIRTQAVCPAAAGELLIVIGRIDDNNYIYGRLVISAGVGTISVGYVVGGVDTPLGQEVIVADTGTDLEEVHDLNLCIRPGDTQTPQSGSAFRYPTVVSGTGWTNVDNVKDDDAALAYFQFGLGPTTGTIITAGYLFGSIPSGSTIDGIEVTVGGAFYTQQSSGDPPVVTCSAQLFDETGLVGDVKGPTAVGSSAADIGFGGATDDWNAGMSRSDVVDPVNFGVAVSFTTNEDRVDAVELDWIGITVYYTTPERTRGAIQFIYNNQDLTANCALTLDMNVPDIGTGNGLLVVSGNWEFQNYTIEYIESQAHPSCPACNCPGVCEHDCCTPATALPSTLVIGELGGWTDTTGTSWDGCPNEGGGCSRVDGFYVVEQVETDDPTLCSWSYTEELECTDTLGFPAFECSGLGQDFGLRLDIAVNMLDGCVLQVHIALQFCLPGPGGTDNQLGGHVAVYESDPIEDSDCSLPITLNLIDEYAAPNTVCVNGMPATITIDAI